MKKIIITIICAIILFSNSLSYAEEKTPQPLEISAAGSLEWDKANQKYTAYKDVKVAQGEVTINCDTLSAHYNNAENLTDISTLEAIGNVTIISNPYKANGDKAIYDVITGRATLTGRNLKVSSANEVLTARDRIEFLNDKKLVIAYGRPSIKQNTDTITADRMEAHLKEGKNGKMASDKMIAKGNVVIETKSETITGSELVFNSQTRQAIMSGNVTIKRGDDFLKGEKAMVDMNSGISQLLGNSTAADGSGRVRGVFFPKR